LFSVIGFPHRNDVASLATLRPHHDHHAAGQTTHRDHTDLSIVEPIIGLVIGVARKHLGRICEIQLAFRERGIPLNRIEGDLHRQLCTHINADSQD
jgi:hypothetical protein